MSKALATLAIVATALFVGAASIAEAHTRGPARAAAADNTLGRTYCSSWLRAYRLVFRPFIRSDCPMTPSCSAYAREAIVRHGAFAGVVLTADRLLHETDEGALVRRVEIPGRGLRCLDPVERNTAWWPSLQSAGNSIR